MSLGNSRTAAFAVAAAIGVLVFALAFIAEPRSCEGGLELYFWSGVAALIALTALPPVMRIGGSRVVCLAWAAAFLLFGAAVWVGGLFAANVRIICHLF